MRSTVELAHSLELEVVAEGVEDGATLDALREMGCEWVQGYHFTRPLPPDALLAWHRANELCEDRAAMASLPPELRRLIDSGPLAHLSTTNADGSPQVSVIWIGIDGEHLVTAHMREQLKLRNMPRDPRVVLSLEGPREPGVFLAPYAVVRARAAIEGPTEDAWELLDRLAKVYVAPGADFPAPRGVGWIVRYSVSASVAWGPGRR